MTHDIAIDQFRQYRALPGPHPFAQRSRAEPTAQSLYIHVPFCVHKCGYCDFYSLVDTEDRQSAFVDRLEQELAAWADWATPIRTVFVGGGTPTLLSPALWRRLLACLHRHFDLSPLGAGGEFTVECNPETATEELFAALASGGVNRVSIGAQSFRKEHLQTLDRWHRPESVGRALEIARAAGIPAQSLDLIFAVPGQTLDHWREDIEVALAMGIQHLSCYALTYEPGTAMTARLARDEFQRADEDLEADMYELALATCRTHGLERYEVSNFARPGAECRHNLAYWRQDPWLAAGPIASGHLLGYRWKNVPRLGDYLAGSHGGFPMAVDVEAPEPARALAERLMSGIRLTEGTDAAAALASAATLGPETVARIQAIVARAIAAGELARVGDRWVPTDRGILFADRLGSEFVRALR